jgi:hypothetical protein
MWKPVLLMVVGLVLLVGSVVTDANTVLLMSEKFASTLGQPPELAGAELAGIEPARRFCAEPACMAAAMLPINAVIVAILACQPAPATLPYHTSVPQAGGTKEKNHSEDQRPNLDNNEFRNAQ